MKYFPRTSVIGVLQKSRKTCKTETLNLKILEIESSSCPCSMTSNGQGVEIQKCTSNSEKIRDSREDTGHSSALETKRSGTELSITHLKENGIPSPRRWWNDSKKPVTQYSRVSVLEIVGILKRKRNRDTIHFNANASNTELLFRTIHQQISSVSTEQSQANNSV